MRVRFLEPAKSEFKDAVSYYNIERPGRGRRFAAEVKRAIERIVWYPDAWSSLSIRTRRCIINGFPYGIVFQIRGDTILVVSVMHLRRDPKSWMRRLEPDER